MVAELGHLCLWLALAIALLQTLLCGYAGAQTKAQALAASIGNRAAWLQAGLIFAAFCCLMISYINSDFSVLNVFQNSHTEKPLLYKISGTWGNHEGSLLLWVLVLALFGAGITLSRSMAEPLKSWTLCIQGLLGVCFIGFTAITSNPFQRLFPVPPQGQDLNPLLQDPGLAFHPPFLYLGYVGFSLTFAIAIAALLSAHKPEQNWARAMRPVALIAWSALTLGIALGSWWAYYELGWGGWWFWDPVENASLMPWLLGTALLHSISVVEKRDSLKIWTILLAILTFSLSLLGTFLVRSGVLTSVHSFALDPERGLGILFLIMALTGGGLFLFALRASKLGQSQLFSPISRESALLFNNLLLCISFLTVLVGTLYPLILEAITGDKISVGPPFFNATFVPLMLPLLIIMVVGPKLRWRLDDLPRIIAQLKFALIAGLMACLIGWLIFQQGPVVAWLGLFAGGWLLAGTAQEIAKRAGGKWQSLPRLPLRFWGMSLGHLGLAVSTLGMTASAIWTEESLSVVQPGAEIKVAQYTLAYQGVSPIEGPNYVADEAQLSLFHGSDFIQTLRPQRRWYPAAEKNTTEAAIYTTFFADVYAVLGDPIDEGRGGWTVRVFHHPLVPWIWLGCLIMAMGGLLSWLDRSAAKRQHNVVAPSSEKAKA